MNIYSIVWNVLNLLCFVLFRWKTQLQELTKLPPFAKVSITLLHQIFFVLEYKYLANLSLYNAFS